MGKNIFTKSELTRQFIIEKSAPVFNKKGFAGTSLSDLTRATGLTKGSIYGNFKDKDDVAVSVFKYNLNNLINFLTREMTPGETAVEKLRAIPAAYRKLYKNMVEFGGCPLLNTATEADDTHQTLCKLTAEAIGLLKKTITRLVLSGQQTGQIKPEADADRLSEVALSLIEGGSFLSKVTGEKSYMMNSLDLIEELIAQVTVPK
ncbi:MAG: TetR/AcrR family transcriptional regulator [Syntrophobacteraceae bacterium]|nr:TetR/AcrR family transcriptional regulator [Syntrophobacteraceae bacterium]